MRWLKSVKTGLLLLALVVLPAELLAQESWRSAFRAYQQGDLATAERLFREVVREYEDAGVPWGWAHMMLGVVLGQRDRHAEALSELELARGLVTTDSERFQVNSSMAQIYLVQGRSREALEAVSAAEVYTENTDQRGLLIRTKAQAHYNLENWRAAAEAFEQAILTRSSAQLHGWLGRSYYELEDSVRAEEQLERAIELDPSHGLALYYLALIHWDDGKLAEAVDYLERAVAALPADRSTEARELLAEMRAAADDVGFSAGSQAAEVCRVTVTEDDFTGEKTVELDVDGPPELERYDGATGTGSSYVSIKSQSAAEIDLRFSYKGPVATIETGESVLTLIDGERGPALLITDVILPELLGESIGGITVAVSPEVLSRISAAAAFRFRIPTSRGNFEREFAAVHFQCVRQFMAVFSAEFGR